MEEIRWGWIRETNGWSAIGLCWGHRQKLLGCWNMINGCSAKPISSQKSKGRTGFLIMHDRCHSVQFLLIFFYLHFFTSATWHMSGIPLNTTRRNLTNLSAETLSWPLVTVRLSGKHTIRSMCLVFLWVCVRYIIYRSTSVSSHSHSLFPELS